MNIFYFLDKLYYREGRTDNVLKPERTDNVLYYITSQSYTRYQDSTFSVAPSPIIPRAISVLVDLIFLIFGVFTPLSAIFQLYHGDQFQWWKKLEYPERTTDHGQATGKLYHLRLRVECTFFVIYKAGREPTPYW